MANLARDSALILIFFHASDAQNVSTICACSAISTTLFTAEMMVQHLPESSASEFNLIVVSCRLLALILQIGDPVKDTTILDNKITISEETSTPPSQVSQINPTGLREFLPEPQVFVVLKSHFKNNNKRSQINKFHVIITIPPSLIAQFANVIQKSFLKPYDELKTAILQCTAEEYRIYFNRSALNI
ncbi:hypothetical protein ACTXT7_003317 [Hymenolepis weldensis]